MVADCYADDRFNQANDKKSGFRTENMLCMPLKASPNMVVGVLQFINKAKEPFDEEDEMAPNTRNEF